MKSQAKKLITSYVSVGLLFFNFASAAIVNCKDCSLGDLVTTIKIVINMLLSYAWLVSVILVVVAGLQLVFAGGNEEAVQKAKTNLSHAIIGFIIILISFVLINFVIAVLTGNKLDLTNAIKLLP